MKPLFLIGRIAFGGFFLYNGIHHFLERKNMAKYAGAKGVPLAEAAVISSGMLLLVGGASLITGVKPKFGAACIIAFLAGVSPVMHDFWNAADTGQKTNDMINFTKNMALLGATLTLAGVEEPWPASIPL